MVTEINYINIREILSRLTRHPLLQDLNLEQAVQYTLDFIALFGLPKMYEDKEMGLHIENYRAILPCDLVSINQVKDCKTSICLRSMTDTFKPNVDKEFAFKTQGRVIFISFKTGDVLISYKSIPTDEDGFPLLIDNPTFLKCLESYIKKEVFTILFDMGKINAQVLNGSQQSYAWLAGQLQSEFTTPSTSEMESIKNMWCTLVQRTSDFENGFKSLGSKEFLKLH